MKKRTPIILIGAARSGTKMLRNIISTHPEIDKIPFDINFVWKYGNEHISHDALTTKDIKPNSKKFILNYFQNFGGENSFIIEKTVSNTLRVEFVYQLFPDAKYIYLTRDGRDVVESVHRQWGVAPDNSYLLEKIKTFPLLKTLSYGWQYGLDLIKIKLFGKPSASYVWGVKYPGHEKDLEKGNILAFCAKQWKMSINMATAQINIIPAHQVLKIRYEEFVNAPSLFLKKISAFLNIDPNFDAEEIKKIKPSNIGRGFKILSKQQQKEVLNIIQPILEELNQNEL